LSKNNGIKDDDDTISTQRILVPIDGSSYSMKAAKYAIKIARNQNAQLFCVYVFDRLPYGLEACGSGIEECLKYLEDQAHSWLNMIESIAKGKGVRTSKFEIIKDFRSIIDSIINYSENNDIDLIVIGTRGRTGIQRLLLGSIANGVSQHAHCSVLLVR
jgi:nucleotide-binding universal stress UspA family protein